MCVCVCVCVCLGLREARQLATGATPAQTGVGSLHERLSSQMVNWLTGSLSGWLAGCLAGLVAHWLSGWKNSAW